MFVRMCPYLPFSARKTTLTEKLLLFGGAIQLAGEVKARGERRRVRSDWMAVERERGISVSSAVMSFEHEGLAFNLLDTRGHQDFSPLGFRRGHLPHPDRGRQRAVIVLDAGTKRASRADPQALRGLPAVRRADLDLCQQARPRGPRPVRPHRRDRAVSGARRDPGLLSARPFPVFRGRPPSRPSSRRLRARGYGSERQNARPALPPRTG